MLIPALIAASLASAVSVASAAPIDATRSEAEYALARSLVARGLPVSASIYYGRITARGPADPFYARAVRGQLEIADRVDETALPAGLGADALDDLPAEIAGRVAYALASSAFRAGRYDDASALVQRVPRGDAWYPRAQYLEAVLARRSDPDEALRTFRSLVRIDAHGSADLIEVKQLAQLGIARTLYGMRRYAEASAAYQAVPRFSRHWDEALFEGAYADLRNGDPGAALGKLHTLRAPQLRDAFSPESENLAAILYHRNCLWPQVREALQWFQTRYEPMRDGIQTVLAKKPSPEELIAAAEGGNALPGAVRNRLARDERLDAALSGLRRIAAEQRKVEGDAELTSLLAGYRAQLATAAAKRIADRLSELVRIVDSLDGENEIVNFETTKGEKEFLEEGFDPSLQLASQTLHRPKLSAKGEEYWQFEDEYWPDEIGYYRHTLKNACPAPRSAEAQATAPQAPATAEEAARDAAVEAKRDEMIADLDRILRKVDEGPRKADMYFQLAELWWEKAQYASLQEVRDYDERYGAWLANREKEARSAGTEPKVSTEKSDGYRKKALALYQDVLQRYPAYARKDELLFVLAYNQYEVGEKSAALRSYQALIDQFPGSRFVPDAYVQMGEHYFQHDDLTRARAAFEKAVSFRLPKVYAFALYKLAWCDYNAHDYRGAIAKLEEVIDYSERQTTGPDRDRIQLKNEALKDLVLPFAQVDAIEGASAYFESKAGSGSVELTERLAATYFESGKYDQAIRVYRLMQAKAPDDARAAVWQEKVLLAYDKLNRRDAVAQETERLVTAYGPRSEWAKAKAAKGASLDEANQLAETALRELVQDYHQEAIKTKNAATYRLARDIYRRYLGAFPDAESAYNLRFYYAEILYALEEWEAAAEQYGRVADADAKGEHAQRAAYDAILALEKAVAVSEGKLRKSELEDAAPVDEKRPKGTVQQGSAIAQGGAEEAIPELEQKLIAACERYARLSPDAPDQVAVRYKAAYILYQHHHYAEAQTRFAEIVHRWPANPIARKAADLSLDMLNSKQEWLALGDLANEFRANPALAPPGSDFAQRAAKIAEGARFKHALDIYEQKKDYARAANEFKKFVEDYPRSEYAPVALNDCVVIAEQGEQLDLVIAAAARLLESYPDAPEALRKPAMLSLASAYERTARFTEAVRWYERYAATWPADAKAPDQLFNAALWREGAGDDSGALADWRKYVERYAARADAPRIAFNIGLILERLEDWRSASAHWQKFQRDYQRRAPPGQLLLARYKEGLAREKLGKHGGAAAFAEVGQRFQALPEAERTAQVIDAAAHARFLLVEPVFEAFLGIHFRAARQAEMVSALKSKNARMTALVAAYREVVAIGSPQWSEAALTRLGEAYRDFNKGLLDAPAPRGLDAEQRELYRTMLQSQALPLEDKAVDAFREAIELSHRTGFYSDWTVRAQRALREYRPDQVAELREPALVGSVGARAVAPDDVGVRAVEGRSP
ncbi:MAG TPA: tetratricopeptide repeat protein [Myxococcales bacterium]|nr:tetratricopeptide repeat protein [Myxococcales bacterium]